MIWEWVFSYFSNGTLRNLQMDVAEAILLVHHQHHHLHLLRPHPSGSTLDGWTSESLICFGSEKQSARSQGLKLNMLSPGFCVEKCGSRPLIFHGCMSWQRPDSVHLHWEHFNTIHVGNCALERDLVICEIDLTMKTRPCIGLKQVAELYLIFIDAMPTGFVCQLHYHGGGSLLCQTSTGDSWQLPFAHAQPHVRIGHAVSFSLAADRADFVVDLEVIQEKTAKPSAHAEKGLRSIQEEARPAPSSARQPPRKLQQSITRFHNADLEERLHMIEAAESLLSDLLNAVELDGDAICKLLCRCAGWLRAPGSFEAKHVAAEVAASEVATVSQPSGPSDLQCRVRRLLISALSSLDLGDITTYQAVETAVLHILQLMQGKEILFCGNDKSLAVRQWQQLRQLLVTDDAQHGPTKRKASDDAPEVLKERVARRVVAKDRSAVVDGLYRPNERVRSLPSVYEALDQVVLLKCSNCVKRISTSWFWKHPRHGRICALVPSSGHRTCRDSLGKRCPWISLDGTYTCLDTFMQLDFCHHNRQRSYCKECGGSEICPHNRCRCRCSVCKSEAQGWDVTYADSSRLLHPFALYKLKIHTRYVWPLPRYYQPRWILAESSSTRGHDESVLNSKKPHQLILSRSELPFLWGFPLHLTFCLDGNLHNPMAS